LAEGQCVPGNISSRVASVDIVTPRPQRLFDIAVLTPSLFSSMRAHGIMSGVHD
jgi:hypothetical protein